MEYFKTVFHRFRVRSAIFQRRKKYFLIKLILSICLMCLGIASVIRFIQITFENHFGDVENFLETEFYNSIKLDLPHYTDLNQTVLTHTDAPGEYGRAVVLTNLSKAEKDLETAGWERHAFNEYVSDTISLHRKLPDVRPRGCRTEVYSRYLPKTSVIICFHNEAWSVLLRTVHSVLDRSPESLIEEIILVDDFSDFAHLGKQLEDYVSNLSKVKIVRATKREGLIRARLLGVSEAKAHVLTFLDSHCECAAGWLEPLLQQIYDNWNTVVSPVIDSISDDTFAYNFKESDEIGVGGFTWDLDFDWRVLTESEETERENNWQPVRTPTMPGGIFAISAKFFSKLGKYDEEFEIWGGENLELSFKTWMCGGILEIVPCSRVGHVFRSRSPYIWKPGILAFERNTIRLAEVWLDEYKPYFYRRIGAYAEKVAEQGGFGDVSSRKQLRSKLNCNSFDWYLKNVYPEQYIPENPVAEGEIRNIGDGAKFCLDGPSRIADLGLHIAVNECHLEGGNQYFLLTNSGEIRRDQACLDYTGYDVFFNFCHGGKGNQWWSYNRENQELKHEISNECMEMTADLKNVTMRNCNGSERQKWRWHTFDQPNLI